VREGRKATGLPESAGPPKWFCCTPFSWPLILQGEEGMGQVFVFLKSKRSFMSVESELVRPTTQWRHDRHTVLVVGVCVLIGAITLNSSRSADASVMAAHGTSASVATRALSIVDPSVSLLSGSGLSAQRRRLPVNASVPPLTPVTAQNPGAPVVSSLSPSTVSAGGGATVIIKGGGFSGASAVYFGTDESSNFSVISPTVISATAPSNAGIVGVSVITPLGTSAATQGSQLSNAPTGQLPITASGQNLEIAGVPTKFTGVNAYELATAWGTNAGCGTMETPAQIVALFSSLAKNSIVRFWAFQGTIATNYYTHQIDWAPIDQIFYLAAQYHVYLLPAITSQGGSCDGGHWQDPSWYNGGYKDVFDTPANSDGKGLTSLSYWDYMQDFVNRYKSSPALAMWEPISEPEASSCAPAFQPTNCAGHATCPSESVAASALRSFFDNVGGEIHSLDPVHLVEAGLLGGGQCGISYTDFEKVEASPGVDVLSVHDYDGSGPLGGDQWNGLAERFSLAAALDKPIITGEVGIVAGNGPGCESFSQRTAEMSAKKNAQFAAGSSAFLVWNWVPDPLGPCNYNTGPGDSLMGLLDGAS
jgi:mannan endo-1,4-beta-mannosidase